MMRLSAGLLAIALVLCSCATAPKGVMRVHPDDLVSHDGIRHYLGQDPFTGVTELHHPNGRIYKLNHFKNGYLDGVSTEWRDDGSRRLRSEWVKGVLNGPYCSWYRGGGRKLECTFADMRRDGLARQWHENGQLQFEARYDASGQPALMRKWQENGVCRRELSFFNTGIPEGEFKWWYPNGQIMLEGVMEDGVLLFLRSWSRDGKTREQLWPKE